MYYFDYRDELMHYGVLGMKWGVRRYQDYGHGGYNPKGNGRKVKARPSNKFDKIKYAPVIYRPPDYSATDAVIESAFMNMVPGIVKIAIRLVQGIKNDSRHRKAEVFVHITDRERANAETDPNTGLKVKRRKLSDEEDAKRVNPLFGMDDVAASNNCVNCSYAMVMREKGYEVQAKLNDKGVTSNKLEKHTKKYFPDAKRVSIVEAPNEKDRDAYSRFYMDAERRARTNNSAYVKNILSKIESEPSNSFGTVEVSWDRYSGHNMFYKINSAGKLQLMDGQDGVVLNVIDTKQLIAETCTFNYTRLDNVDFDKNKIKEVVR